MGLMEDTYSYQQLQSKYGNFTVPAAKLLVGGTNILGLKDVSVHSINIRLSLNAASSASFSISGSYDYKNGSFDANLKSKAVLGKTVEVELGYGSSTTNVFKGFLASVNINFDVTEGITYDVVALDARRLMMSDNKPIRNHTVNHYSDAVKTIMKRYKKLCEFKSEDTQDNLNEKVITQSVSDYDFIVRELIGSGKVDREFFIVGDTAYFRKPKGSGTVMLTLSIGEGLKSFRRSASYLNHKIVMLGQEEGTNKALSGEALAKSTDSLVNALGDVGEVMESAPDCHSAEALKKRAENKAGELQDEGSQATASCVGLAELVPGRYIKIDRVDESVDQKYYVTGVTHSYSMGGFVTSLEMEGWK